jgi:predicted acylesterase/phospholipase RssA
MGSDCYRVLAVDGGGIRGLIPATVLEEIETRMQRPIAELFDLVAGTSTGGILALGLTKPDPADRQKPQYSATDMSNLYLQDGQKIFPHSLIRKVETGFGVLDAKYPADAIEAILKDRFGDTMLSDALTEVVIPSYDLTGPGPYFFKREYAKNETEDWDVPMRDVARATSAAPTYFDPAECEAADGVGRHALVDGGTFANNPTLSGYVDALRLGHDRPRIVVVSIGTGLPSQTPGSGPIPIEPGHVKDFGLVKWARPLLEVVLDGVPKAVEYQMNAIATASPTGLVYYRLQSDLPTASHAMDDASPGNTQKLVADARTLITQQAATLEQAYAQLA